MNKGRNKEQEEYLVKGMLPIKTKSQTKAKPHAITKESEEVQSQTGKKAQKPEKEKSGKKAPDQKTAQHEKKSPEQAKTQTGKKTSEQVKAQTGKKAPEQAKAQTGKKASEQAKAQTGKKAPEQVKAQTGKKAPEQAKMQTGKKASEQVKAQTGKKAPEQMGKKSGRKTPEQMEKESGGKTPEQQESQAGRKENETGKKQAGSKNRSRIKSQLGEEKGPEINLQSDFTESEERKKQNNPSEFSAAGKNGLIQTAGSRVPEASGAADGKAARSRKQKGTKKPQSADMSGTEKTAAASGSFKKQERPLKQRKSGEQRKPGVQQDRSGKKKEKKKNPFLQDKKELVKKLLKSDAYVPMKEKEMAVLLQVQQQDRELLKQVLEELLEEGSIQISSRGRYSEAQETVYTGTFISNQKGFGFVEVDGLEEDLFIPERYVHGAFHLDTVKARVISGRKGKRTEAEIAEVLERSTRTLVGTYEKSKNFGFVVPDNTKIAKDIFVAREQSLGAVDGQKVVVELQDYGNDGKKPQGRVTEILGHVNDPGVDILSIVKNFELPDTFPEKVLQQAQRAAQPLTDADRAGRLDLRSLRMVTIDGEDSKDLDDAVSLVRKGLNYQLGVHIADVSNYVQEGSAVDREALKRGTSVYLADRVIPMLPHALCNDICSLNEGEDRLALSCLMTVSPAGEVLSHTIAESVICVDRRMTYTAVKGILEDKDKALRKEYRPLVHMLERMGRLSAVLREKRRHRGSIDFDFPESKLILDGDGHPLEIKAYERNTATDLIEDFMLLANETVARHFSELEAPFVYRTHEKPDPEKIETLAVFIHNFGYYLKSEKEEVRPKELQKLLAKVAGTPEEALINRLTLRSMRQAKYTTDSIGHFGLAAPYYCHFTSPIRRYPDLQIHRIIKEQLRGKLGEERIRHYQEILTEICNQCSKMERRANDAERETEKLKKAEFMEAHVGETWEGVISGITGWGMYVELPNTVEGMIPAAKMAGDYYYYDEATYEMVGQATGRKFRLGQQLKIRVEEVNRLNKTIDFSLVEDEE